MKKFFKIGLSVLLIVMSVLIPDYKSINVGVSAEPIHDESFEIPEVQIERAMAMAGMAAQ